MEIANHIERVRDGLRRGSFTSEAAVSQGILLPILNELGWPVFNTTIVVPEYSVEGRRVDYALCHPENRPAVFVEVKKVGYSESADRQLFEYAFHVGVPMAILTDGQEWSFYLPGEQGNYYERRVYKIDLLQRSTGEASERLTRYLSYERICSGEALQAARSDYRDVAREREIKETLPKAWNALLKEQDSLLLELLADKVEDISGYKPDLDACGQFIENIVTAERTLVSYPPTAPVKAGAFIESVTGKSRTRKVKHFTFKFRGNRIDAGSAKEVMVQVFRLLAQEDSGFLERFAARKHGRKRRYLAKERQELYPGRPDLAEEQSVEIVPGWWLGTNYSRKNIQEIIDLACEVAGTRLGSAVEVKVD
jgi:hypothetical protein